MKWGVAKIKKGDQFLK